MFKSNSKISPLADADSLTLRQGEESKNRLFSIPKQQQREKETEDDLQLFSIAMKRESQNEGRRRISNVSNSLKVPDNISIDASSTITK